MGEELCHDHPQVGRFERQEETMNYQSNPDLANAILIGHSSNQWGGGACAVRTSLDLCHPPVIVGKSALPN